MSIETAAVVCLIASRYLDHRPPCALPPHLIADLQEILQSDLPSHVKHEANRLLTESP